MRADALDRLVERARPRARSRAEPRPPRPFRRRRRRGSSSPGPSKPTISPVFSFFAGRTKARQRFAPSRLCSVASIRADASPRTRRPRSRAGMTRVSLTTRTSPGRQKARQSRGRSGLRTQRRKRRRGARRGAAPRRAARRGAARCAQREDRNRRGQRAWLVTGAPEAAFERLSAQRRADDLVGIAARARRA